MEAQYQSLSAMMRAATGNPPSVVQRLIVLTANWRHEVRRLGFLVELLPASRVQEIESLFKTMMQLALQNIHTRCSQDPIAIFDVLPLIQIGYRYHVIQSPPSLQPQVEAVFGCLRFKLKFESTIVESNAVQSVTTAVLADGITLRGRLSETSEDLEIKGEGTIQHTKVLATEIPECVNLYSFTPSTFKAELFWNVNNGIALPYDRGTPHDEVSVSCRGGQPSIIGQNFWLGGYDFTHREQDSYNQGGYTRIQTGWVITGSRDPWAHATVATTRRVGPVSTAEITRFTLTHTPE